MPRDAILTRDFALVRGEPAAGSVVFPVHPLARFLTDMGANEVEIGLVIGAAAIAAIASRPAIGRVMDTRVAGP